MKQAIVAAQARGVQVAIATGRMYRSALRFHQEINSSLPLLAYQGAWIQDPVTQKIHRHLPVSRELAHKLLNYFEQPELQALLSVHFYINDQLYVREITRETELYAEGSGITPFANKGTGVRYLAEELLGLQRTNVMTIGDNFNDVEMLEYAGIGVAMGNAPAAVKAITQWVAPDVEQDGAVAAIEKFLLS